MGGEGGDVWTSRGDSLCPTDKSTIPPPPHTNYIYPHGGGGEGGSQKRNWLRNFITAKFYSEILNKFLNLVYPENAWHLNLAIR
jgi:hypothetical protein